MADMKHDYHEGPEALERFEQGMSRLFKPPKPTEKDKATLRPLKIRANSAKNSPGKEFGGHDIYSCPFPQV